MRTLNTPPAAPPPAANTAPAVPVPPAGVSAETLWKKAVRDYTGAKDKQALAEFADFLKYFPDDTNAPEGQYYMGLIYDHGEQYDDAAQVFQAVIDRYPDSPKAADAMYMKGVEYQKGGSDKEAVAAYRAFVKQYPKHANVPKAQARLRALHHREIHQEAEIVGCRHSTFQSCGKSTPNMNSPPATPKPR